MRKLVLLLTPMRRWLVVVRRLTQGGRGEGEGGQWRCSHRFRKSLGEWHTRYTTTSTNNTWEELPSRLENNQRNTKSRIYTIRIGHDFKSRPIF